MIDVANRQLAAGDCDLDDVCTGTSAFCKANFKSGNVCRVASGPCDAEEVRWCALRRCALRCCARRRRQNKTTARHAMIVVARGPFSGARCVPAIDRRVRSTRSARADRSAAPRPGQCRVVSCRVVSRRVALMRRLTSPTRQRSGCDQAEVCDGSTDSCGADLFYPSVRCVVVARAGFSPRCF